MRAALACAVLLCAAGPSQAQEQPGSVYVSGGVSFPSQPPKQAGSPPPFAAPGGSTVGWSIGAGVHMQPRVSIEGQISTTGVMSSNVLGRHELRAAAQRQDRFFSVGVKGHLQVHSAVRVEPVGGVVFIREEASGEDFRYRLTSTGLVLDSSTKWSDPPEWTTGLMMGVDLRIGGRHVAFLPGLRATFAGATGRFYPDLYPRWTYRPALAVGVNF